MQFGSDDFECVRCGVANKWEHFHSTPAGDLFCQGCWKSMDLENEAKRKCPVDGIEMVKKLILGLAVIDICPTCEGIWFDKNELKVIQKESEKDGRLSTTLIGTLLLRYRSGKKNPDSI